MSAKITWLVEFRKQKSNSTKPALQNHRLVAFSVRCHHIMSHFRHGPPHTKQHHPRSPNNIAVSCSPGLQPRLAYRYLVRLCELLSCSPTLYAKGKSRNNQR